MGKMKDIIVKLQEGEELTEDEWEIIEEQERELEEAEEESENCLCEITNFQMQHFLKHIKEARRILLCAADKCIGKDGKHPAFLEIVNAHSQLISLETEINFARMYFKERRDRSAT